MPSLTVVCGNAGTGKSTWAKLIAQRVGAALLDLDTVSERLVAAAQREWGRSEHDRDSAEYKRVFREPVHETLFAIARDCAGPVVIVAPFTRERSLPNFREWLSGKCARLAQVHYFVCDEQVREARLRARGNPRDAAKFLDYAAYRSIAPGERPPAYPHLWFDTTHYFPGEAELIESSPA
ncbi:MAG: ATP-binding protein [Myxococcales bacterium]|nr:MAG: ATP-binding protein [Myxococcales bacterium]